MKLTIEVAKAIIAQINIIDPSIRPYYEYDDQWNDYMICYEIKPLIGLQIYHQMVDESDEASHDGEWGAQLISLDPDNYFGNALPYDPIEMKTPPFCKDQAIIALEIINAIKKAKNLLDETNSSQN